MTRCRLQISTEEFSELPFDFSDLDVLATDLAGQAVNPPVRYGLLLTPRYLWFLAERDYPPRYDSRNAAGSFVEGLWEMDCAEVFIAAESGERYQEFNLSPGGAWWSCVFESYRKRLACGSYSTPEVRTFSAVSPNSWRASLRITRSSIGVDARMEDRTRMNCAFILDTPQKFLSACELKSEHPDFHLASQFPTAAVSRFTSRK